MSWRAVILGGFISALIGAVAGLILVMLATSAIGWMIAGATLGAIIGSSLGWYLMIVPVLSEALIDEDGLS